MESHTEHLLPIKILVQVRDNAPREVAAIEIPIATTITGKEAGTVNVQLHTPDLRATIAHSLEKAKQHVIRGQ